MVGVKDSGVSKSKGRKGLFVLLVEERARSDVVGEKLASSRSSNGKSSVNAEERRGGVEAMDCAIEYILAAESRLQKTFDS